MTAEEQLQALYREQKEGEELAKETLYLSPINRAIKRIDSIRVSPNGCVFFAAEHIDLIANLVVERLREVKL